MGMKPRPKREKKNGATRRGKFTDEMKVISVIDNPKRPNTKAHQKFAMFRKGMTLGAYREAVDKKFGPGEASAEINYSVQKGFIKVG